MDNSKIINMDLINNNRPRFSRNKLCIELVITYECNRACFNCEAMVRQAPSKESMSLEQLSKFINESIDRSVKWQNIRVLGGEPTLHKDIYQFIEMLLKYKQEYSPNTIITLVTNGFGDYVNRIVKDLETKYDIEVQNSLKTTNFQPHFSPVNLAPTDVDEYKYSDLTKGCWITSICGMALDLHGYYPCTTAAAIDRVFGYNIGRKSLPSDADTMRDLYEKFCKLCGHYPNKINNIVQSDIFEQEHFDKLEKLINENQKIFENEHKVNGEIFSKTWETAIANWKAKKTILDKY